MNTSAQSIPVTAITGFLGSGKTTLINRILRECHGRRIAVIENEFGEVGIDDALVLDLEGTTVFELNHGCICCTVQGDLVGILRALMSRSDRPDHILIETTGLADPSPIVQTFFVDDEIRSWLRLDAIVTMVDAAHVLRHLDEVKPDGVENEAVEQVAFADRLILNKVDLTEPEHLNAVVRRLREINALAEIVPTQRGNVDLGVVLNVGAFELQRVLDEFPDFLEQSDHRHDPTVTSVGWKVEGSVDIGRLNDWLEDLLGYHGLDIFRSKGILALEGLSCQYVFHGVHMLFDGAEGREWGLEEPRVNRMVFIGRHLDRDELEAGFRKCLVDAG